MTVGWILEGDRDRFLSVRDPTPSPGPTLPSFRCPFCKSSFRYRKELDSHVQLSHVVRRPFVLIGGVEPSIEDVIRLRLRSSSVEIFHCTELAAGFDGEPLRPITVGTLTERLAGTRRATLRLRLTNVGDAVIQPVVQEYRLRVVAPDEASLAEVDKLFLARLGSVHADLKQVDLFYEATSNELAAEYAEALGDYVRAVLLKDGDQRTGISSRVHHYHEIQNRALDILWSFDRPLPKLLCALMRFGLNDFSRWSERTGFAHLDHAYRMLGSLAQGEETPAIESGQTQAAKNQVFVCPVDFGTDTVARLTKQVAALPRWGSAAEDQLIALAERSGLDSFDSAKIRALWAMTALRLKATISAQRALRSLDGDPTFGVWANSQLIEG